MRGGDRYRGTGWHHDEAHYRRDNRNGSHVQCASARTQHDSHLGHHRIQDTRYWYRNPEYRNNLSLRRSNQNSILNRPNHHFLAKSKHLKEYLLTSLKSHIDRIEQWLPENECGGGDNQVDSPNVKSNEEMDWQLERELVVEGYKWSSEVLPLSLNVTELKVVTLENGHEEPSNVGADIESAAVPNRCLDIEREDQSKGVAPK
ncbi:hypothetical protein BCIN_08g00180 [Botrytis cinerea B05.10]|jgi:hypothetical protein|uniref:Uncharacterized protein n=3 Tax=Botryotinia fuckeliana TaxID=40559 RepID=A0A384JNT0_BOTFB|nr:hypothetical protein BCIN_08g00180 [Botrytis cinerea B05.10]ATZ52246.1 hypothetical protein BCIN_08g00180 [Botrytis cinerea B05.10]EMR89272.1 hypothetical protein BcDW1_2076 [Botrytis cinerea BcDW1]